MKIIANLPDLYSVLNPETNSDSPSAKSKGVRFVSAIQTNNQRRNNGGNNDIRIIFLFIYKLEINLISKISLN